MNPFYLIYLCTDEGLPRVKHLLFEDGRISDNFKDFNHETMLPRLHTVTFQCRDQDNLPDFQNPLRIPYACFRCPNLERVVFDPTYFTPNSVVFVMHDCFKYCPSLQHFGGPNAIGFDMPPGVWTTVESSAFHGTGLSRATFTWRTRISYESFQKCKQFAAHFIWSGRAGIVVEHRASRIFRANPDKRKIANTLGNLRFMAFRPQPT